jgi:transposase-like protein
MVECIQRKEITTKPRTVYSPEFKAKIVIEVLEGARDLEAIAADTHIVHKTKKNGKNQILIRRNRQNFSLQKAELYGMIQVRNKACDRRRKKAADETR